MTPLGVWLTITIVIAVGLLLGVALSWFDPPRWATPGRLAVILLFIAIADMGVTYLQQTAPVVASAEDQDPAAAAAAAGLVPVGKIDPAQTARTILSITTDTRRSYLVESNLDGAAGSILGPGPQGGQFALAGGNELVVAAVPDGKSGASRLAITSLSGTPLRPLTSPAADTSDAEPVVTADGEVYFQQTTYARSGPIGTLSQVMEVPISGKSRPVRVRTSIPLFSGPISVNPAGTLLAGTCDPRNGAGANQACVLALPSGRIRYMTSLAPSAPVLDVVISPDGKYLAYEDPAANPYGSSQIYVADLATGAVVMVSRLPGYNWPSSWITGSDVPCLLFTNSQTSGDEIYLSCLSAHPSTARIAAGYDPEWLGTTLPAAQLVPKTIDWRALWDRSRPVILLIGTFMLDLLVGLYGGWFPRPAWATWPRLASLIALLGVLEVGGALVVPGIFGQPAGGLTTVAQLDPGQAGGLLVAMDSTTETDQLFGVRLNGTNVQPLPFYTRGSAFIPLNNTASEYVISYGGASDGDIRLVGATGNEIRDLSDPPAGKSDSAPALAMGPRQVFFVRSTFVLSRQIGVVTIDPVVMRVSLTGGPARRVPLTPAPAEGPISVNSAGTELAAACPDGHGYPVQACVYDLSDGRLRYIASTSDRVTDFALSPDGHYLAYSNGIVLYTHDFETGQTVIVSSLPGVNEQPDWLHGGSSPCLLFVNEQTAGETIYLACLTPRLAWAPVTQGEYPMWLGS